MPLPPEFIEFHRSWTEKVNGYTDQTARAYFDRFLTQYVLYNRLYCEATLRLSRMSGSGIRIEGRSSFPDSAAAKTYVAQFLGATKLMDCLEQDGECVAAIAELRRILEQHQFYVKLHPVTGDRQEGDDEQLLVKLTARSRAEQASAILEFIYCIRCNMMHGQKGFSERQINLLAPTTTLLRKISGLLYLKLCDDA